MLTITIDDHRLEAGIEAAMQAYNASLPEPVEGETTAETPFATAADYLKSRIEQVAESYAQKHQVGIIKPAAFLLRFTSAEIDAIKAAADTDATVAAFVDRIQSAQDVWLWSDEVVSGIVYLVTAGLLTQARADQIASY